MKRKISLKKSSICSSYSLADLRHSSCQFDVVISLFPKPPPTIWLDLMGISYSVYHTVKLLPQQLNGVEI